MGKWLIGAALAALAVPAAAQQAPYQRDAREMLEKTVAIRTALGRSETQKMADYLAARFKAAGVPDADIAMLPTGGETGMVVRIPGSDAAARPILFSSHMDVVDANPEDWERDPFKLIEENGYFFGRGVVDNKTGVVSLASTIERIRKDGFKPRRTLVFAFVGDEETRFDTTRLIAEHPWVRNAEFAINTDAGGGELGPDGKPIIYLVQGAEKTYADFDVTVTNPGGHSSRPRSDNAIYDLAAALEKVGAHRFPVQSNPLTVRYLGAVGKAMPGPTGEALRRFSANPKDAAAAEVLRADPAFVGTLGTTCVATMLSGGHAPNALPQKASANVNCRIFPGTTGEEVRAKLAEVIGNPKVKVTLKGEAVESPVSETTPQIDAAIAKAIHSQHKGVPIAPYLESGGTDGRIYRAAGIPTFATSGIFMKSDDMFAHGLNERVPVKAFYEAIDHVHMLAVDLSK